MSQRIQGHVALTFVTGVLIQVSFFGRTRLGGAVRWWSRQTKRDTRLPRIDIAIQAGIKLRSGGSTRAL